MIKEIKKNTGFVILFAITISAILLAIALGVSGIALKEIKFSTSATDTNNSFLAADTGAECALFHDSYSTINSFTSTTPAPINCAGSTITLFGSSPVWSFTVSGLGGAAQSCAKVTVDKTNSPLTKVISKGYNNTCNPTLNTVERQLELNY